MNAKNLSACIDRHTATREACDILHPISAPGVDSNQTKNRPTESKPVQKTKILLFALLLASTALRVGAQISEPHGFASVNKPVPDGSSSGVADVRIIASSIVDIANV